MRYWSIPCIVLTLHLQTHLFGPLKQALKGRQFTTDQQLDVTTHAWLVYQIKTFYSEVKRQIVQWWTKCIVKQGNYVEKLSRCKISALVFLNMKHTVRIIIDSPSYFAHLHSIQTCSGVQPVSYLKGAGHFFHRAKAAGMCSWLPISKNNVWSYTITPKSSSWYVV